MGYLSQDTIASLVTSLGGGAVHIVRVSGPLSLPLLRATTPFVQHAFKSHTLVHAEIWIGQQLIDQGLVVFFKGPKSFTGEDVVEYHLHASSLVVEKLLEFLCQNGARQALPGEFSYRSVRNDKMTLMQATAVSDLIAATGDTALTHAAQKLTGLQKDQLHFLREGLKKILAQTELGLDFSDQNIEELHLKNLQQSLTPLIQIIQKLAKSFQKGLLLQEGLKILLCGSPNAGKSTLFNALCEADRAIVTPLPGTTRDLLQEKILLKTQAWTGWITLQDTAGLRKSSELVEQIGIEKTQKAFGSADLIFYLIDPQTLQDAEVKYQFEKTLSLKDRPEIWVIFTKGDLSAPDFFQEHQKEMGSYVQQTFVIGGLEGQTHDKVQNLDSQQIFGIQPVLEALGKLCKKLTDREENELLITQRRHFDSLQKAHQTLLQAMDSTAHELFALDLRHALLDLAPLFGDVSDEDLLTEIFLNFCIGK